MKYYLGYVVIENAEDFKANTVIRNCGFDRYFIDYTMIYTTVDTNNFPLCLKRKHTPTDVVWVETTKEEVFNAWTEEKNKIENLIKGLE